jgi:hypothetical protein
MISIWLGPREIHYCKEYAERAELGGRSEVRKENRAGSITIDQLVGQLGQYALSVYLTGETRHYYAQRMVADANPTVGDGGQDILGTNLDVKTTLMRQNKNPLTYHLAVRPQERHEGHVYILGLVEPNDEKQLLYNKPLLVHLAGWAEDSELPEKVAENGALAGAYILPVNKLHELIPIRWDWRKYD